MNPSTAHTLRSTWALVAAQPDDFGRVFFSCLFRLDPSLRGPLEGQIPEQRALLLHTLATIVEHLDEVERLGPKLRALQQARPERLVDLSTAPSTAAVLMWTLQRCLGDAWTPTVEGAWEQLMSVVSRSLAPG